MIEEFKKSNLRCLTLDIDNNNNNTKSKLKIKSDNIIVFAIFCRIDSVDYDVTINSDLMCPDIQGGLHAKPCFFRKGVNRRYYKHDMEAPVFHATDLYLQLKTNRNPDAKGIFKLWYYSLESL